MSSGRDEVFFEIPSRANTDLDGLTAVLCGHKNRGSRTGPSSLFKHCISSVHMCRNINACIHHLKADVNNVTILR